MLSRFDVATSREPSLCITVIDEESVFALTIDEHTVGDEVFRRCCWLGGAEDLHSAVEPAQHVVAVFGLQPIQGTETFDQVPDGFSHRSILAPRPEPRGNRHHGAAASATASRAFPSSLSASRPIRPTPIPVR